ncbi:hypothetical protein [uncultured Selenomonas sp.]|uniref:hypothetical protein n=1 Tax=uncultured Selenomonas sp. TaxID=159275 RepID=UPI0025F65FEF|nr:hypothetical protein [uncultured Selenomonas sp.]
MNTETILLVLAMTGLSIGVYRANDEKEALIYAAGIITIFLGLLIQIYNKSMEVGDYRLLARVIIITFWAIVMPFISPYVFTFIRYTETLIGKVSEL